MHPATNGQAGRGKHPSGWQWPLFVIVLLLSSVLWSAAIVFFARSDGGAQVIDNYYQKAVDHDQVRAREARSAALGWQASLLVSPAEAGHVVRCSILDNLGQPVTDLVVMVTAFRPQYTDAMAELILLPTSEAGVYEAAAHLDEAGLWDFEIVARKGDAEFLTAIRTEL